MHPLWSPRRTVGDLRHAPQPNSDRRRVSATEHAPGNGARLSSFSLGKEAVVFAQVITGTVKDREAFTRQSEKWRDEVRPGAVGYLGSTGGIADDGSFIIVA